MYKEHSHFLCLVHILTEQHIFKLFLKNYLTYYTKRVLDILNEKGGLDIFFGARLDVKSLV